MTAANVNADTVKSDASACMALHEDKNIQLGEELIFGDLQSDCNSDISCNITHVDIPLTESSAIRKSPVASPDNVLVCFNFFYPCRYFVLILCSLIGN